MGVVEMERNAELAWQAYDTAIKHGKLDMSMWAHRPFAGDVSSVSLDELQNECGTTACLAGWTVALAGHIMREVKIGNEYDTRVLSSSFEDLGIVPDVAAQLLGIDAATAKNLFWVDDDEVEQAITEIFGPRPEARS